MSYDSNVFYEREDMIQEHLLDTLNIVIGFVEIFLERSEKKIHLQKQGFFEHFEPFFEVDFFKNRFFSLFNV